MVLLSRCSGDGVAINSVKIDIRVPVLSVRYERYSLCALRGIVSALQRYSAPAIIKSPKELSLKDNMIVIKDRDTEEMTLRSLEDIRLIMIDNHSVRISHTV